MHSVRQFLLVVVDFTKSPVRGLARWQGGKWAGEKLPREIQAKILTPFRRLLVWLIQYERSNAEKDAPPPDKTQLERLEKMTSDFLIGFKEATTARHQAQAKLLSSTALKRSVEAILFVDFGDPKKVINGVKIELVIDAKTQMDRLKVNLLQEVYQHFQNSQLFRKPNFLSHLALVFANHDDHPHKDAGPLIESLEWQAVANPAVLARQADLHLVRFV